MTEPQPRFWPTVALILILFLFTLVLARVVGGADRDDCMAGEGG